MLNTFEAIYEDGQLQWVNERPHKGPLRVLVTVLPEQAKASPTEAVQAILDATRGTLGQEKMLDVLDADLHEQHGTGYERRLLRRSCRRGW